MVYSNKKEFFNDLMPPTHVAYHKAEERLRILVSSGAYKIVKRFQRQDTAWPWVYAIVSADERNHLMFFTRQRVG